MRKLLIFATAFLSCTVASGAEKPKAEVFVDASSSMKPFTNQTKEAIAKVEDYLEKKGFEVKLFSFGEDVKELKGVKSYRPEEHDTNYSKLLRHLETHEDTIAVVITDGKIPARRLDDIKKIREEGALLNDAGNVICSLTVIEPTKLVGEFSSVSGSYKDYKKVLNKCITLWETLHGEGKGNVASVQSPVLIKTVREKGFEALGTKEQKAAVKTSGAQVEVIIRTK